MRLKGRLFLAALGIVSMAVGTTAGLAAAAGTPHACTTGIGLKFGATIYEGSSTTLAPTQDIARVGDTIKYSVQAHLTTGECKVTTLALTVTTPDGVTHAVLTTATHVSLTAVTHPTSSVYSLSPRYTVRNADIGTHGAPAGEIHAEATATGTATEGKGIKGTSKGTAPLTRLVIHPETSLTKTATPTTQHIPFSVTYTFTETNISTKVDTTTVQKSQDVITDVVVSDTGTGACTPPATPTTSSNGTKTTLGVGATWVYHCTTTGLFKTAGTFTDHASASGLAGDTRPAGTAASTGAPATEHGTATVHALKATPAIVTSQQPASGTVGTVLNDTVTVTGIVNPVTTGTGHGTLTLSLYKPGACTTAAYSTTVTAPTYSATPATPTNKSEIVYTTTTGPAATVTGTWHWAATYSGDKNNTAATSTCTKEPVKVTPAPSTTKTQQSTTSGKITIGPSGKVHDTVTVTGNTAGGPPKGTVAFYLCGPEGANATCTPSTGTKEATKTLAATGTHKATATSTTLTPTKVGTYCFSAVYTATAAGNYKGSTDNVKSLDANECFTVTPTTSTTKTKQSTPSGTIVIGPTGTVHDTVTVTGTSTAGVPMGTVAFFLCGPGTAGTCSTATGTPEGTAVALTATGTHKATATSSPVTPTTVGTYCFSAVYTATPAGNYTGSSDNTTVFDANECFTVTPTTSTTKTKQSAPSGTIVIGTSGAVHDTVTVTGTSTAGVPKGTVAFYLCGPTGANATCTPATGTKEGTKTLTATGTHKATATSTPVNPTKVGTYCFSAVYTATPAGNYKGSTDNVKTLDANECFTAEKGTITVHKSDTPGTKVAVNPGGTIKYTLTAHNAGTAPGTDTINDTVPSNTTLVAGSVKCVTPLPATGACSVTSATTPLAWSVTVPVGGTVSVSFSVTVKGTDTATVFNHGSFSGPGCTTAPACTTNTVTNPVPNITVAKSDTPGTGVAVNPGGTIKYTLTAHNSGTATGTDTINDTVPANTTLVTGSAACVTPIPATGACSVTSSTTPLAWSVTVPAGGTVSVSFSVTVNAADTATITNHATYTGPGCTTTPSCTTNTVTNPVPNITVHKADSPGTGVAVNPGGTITYTLTAHNSGTAAGTDTINDTVPSNATLAAGSAKCVTPLPATGACSVTSATTPLAWSVTVPAGGTVSVSFSVKVNTADTTTVFNHGTYTGPGCLTASCTTNTVTNPVPNIAVAKADTPASGTSVAQGATLTYTLTAHNSGTAAGTDTINDTVPSNATLVAGSAACVTATGCSVTSSTTPLAWTVTVPAGGTVSVSFKVTVKTTDTTTVYNHGTYTGPGCLTAPACTTNTVTNPVKVPSISVKKLDTPGTGVAVNPGGTITYTLAATNSGTGTGTDAIHDTVPSNTTLVAGSVKCVTPLPATGACSVASSSTPLAWSVTVPAGTTIDVTFSVTVKTTDTTTVLNHGTFTGPGCTTSPACTTNTVTNPVPNITVHKSDSPASGTTVTPGAILTYTLTAHNAGTAAGTDTIHDTVPSNATLVAGSAACVTATGCSVTSATTPLAWTVTVPAGGTVSVTFKVTVKTTDTTTVFNHGTYTGPGCLTASCTTNTVTNPVKVTTVLTLTPGFWKNHGAATTAAIKAAGGFLPLGTYKVTTFTQVKAVLSAISCKTTGIGCLAGQLLAAELNVANGTNTCIAATIAKANALLSAIGYDGPGTGTIKPTQVATAKKLATELSLYNSDNSGICP